MKTEKVLIFFIVSLFILGIITPLFLLCNFDSSIAAQIGDTLGGTTAPFLNISAILGVLYTFLHQRRHERKGHEKELIYNTINTFKDEFEKITITQTKTQGEKKEVQHFKGKEAFYELIGYLNTLSVEQVIVIPTFQSFINIFEAINSLIDLIKSNTQLDNIDKLLFISQISLFYRNNLYLDSERRGDVICSGHNVKHEIPKILYDLICKIESKI